MSVKLTYYRWEAHLGHIFKDIEVGHKPLKELDYKRVLDYEQIIQGDIDDAWVLARAYGDNHCCDVIMSERGHNDVLYTNVSEFYQRFNEEGITMVLLAPENT